MLELVSTCTHTHTHNTICTYNVHVLYIYIYLCTGRYMERLQQEDWENLVKKKEAQISLMEEVTKCNHVGRGREGERRASHA